KKYGEKNSNTSAIIREAVVSYLNPSGNQEIIMAKEINDETIKYFIENHLSVEHFGYLVVTDDARMNEEALSYIKQDFREFIGSEE
ncbi:hypothetical protein KAR91_84930, partial [Candidatus Pacearchaeota archaeon]|nr:hypothetical protein [Candidatus Pacearchaeota archaeon]